jgi:hypothetical protein
MSDPEDRDGDESDPGGYELLVEFSDLGSADAVAGLLAGERIRTKVVAVRPVAGIPSAFRVLVAEKHLHRARWFLEHNEISENELIYLATGKLGGDPE